MDAIQYISDEYGNPTGVIVPIILWRKITSEYEVPNHQTVSLSDQDIEHQTLTLSDQDRDVFLAELESPSLPNAALSLLKSNPCSYLNVG